MKALGWEKTGLLGFILGNVAGALLASPAFASSESVVTQERSFAECVVDLQQQARTNNIADWVVEKELAAVQYVPRVIELDRKQPEFSETFYNYLYRRVNDFRVDKGRLLLQEHRPFLLQLTREYGVPPQYIVAFWGLETNFGAYLGKMNVLDSLATLACDPRRSEFFTQELMEALRILQSKVVTREQMLGSWAGAMGNMQFMPSAYRRYAVDADGDGRADLWGSLEDAFTSAAYFLQQLGWQRELRWGREILLPANFDYGLAGGDHEQPLSSWRKLGLTDVNGNLLPALDLPASVIIPAGHTGPAFVAYENFDVIMKWNRSEFYALAVGHLADRIQGGKPLKQPPPNAERLTIETVKTLQEQLMALGYPSGEPDGILGSRTKRAIRQFQQERGLVADGYPSESVRQTISDLASKQKSSAKD